MIANYMNPALAFVVAHFDPRGNVPAHLYNLLVHMATLTSRIVFVSTRISNEHIARVSLHARVIARPS